MWDALKIRNKPDSNIYHEVFIGKLWKFKKSELDDWVNSGKSAQQKC